MNWGHGILSVIILFVIGIGSLVFIALKQNIEMMDDKYYERELTHQKLIDGEENLNKSGGDITIKDSLDLLVISFPLHTIDNISEGKIHFLRPSDQRLDKVFDFAPENGKVFTEKSKFINGKYQIRFSWKNNDKSYYKQIPYLIK